MPKFEYEIKQTVYENAANAQLALENIKKRTTHRHISAVKIELKNVIFSEDDYSLGNIKYDASLDMIVVNNDCYIKFVDIKNIEPQHNTSYSSRYDGDDAEQYDSAIITTSGTILFLDDIIHANCYDTNDFIELAEHNCKIYNDFLNNIKLLRQIHDDNK